LYKNHDKCEYSNAFFLCVRDIWFRISQGSFDYAVHCFRALFYQVLRYAKRHWCAGKYRKFAKPGKEDCNQVYSITSLFVFSLDRNHRIEYQILSSLIIPWLAVITNSVILIPIPLPPSDLRLEGFSSLFFRFWVWLVNAL